MSEQEVWYRYEERRYAAPLNEYEEPIGRGSLEVKLYKLPVFKHTPKGVWLGFRSREKFVLMDARKRYACPTIEEAQESFLARKYRQLRIYRTRIANIEEAVRIIKYQQLEQIPQDNVIARNMLETLLEAVKQI